MTDSLDLPVLIAPNGSDALVAAVRSGGGRLVAEPTSARALVWTGRKDASIADYLAASIEWVQLPAAGVERWLEADILDTTRVWTSAAGAYAPQVAAHALSLLLACAHRIPEHADATTWTRIAHRPLGGSVVGVIGAGGVGTALIRLLEPLGVTIVAVNRSGRPVEGADETHGIADLDHVLRRTDHVVLALPSTPHTVGLFDRAKLLLLKKHSIVVNVGRGDALDLADLQIALDGGWIAYAGLDVTEPEPLPDAHPLWRNRRAVITSHSANPPGVLAASLAERVRENVRRFLDRRPLLGQIDVHRGY